MHRHKSLLFVNMSNLTENMNEARKWPMQRKNYNLIRLNFLIFINWLFIYFSKIEEFRLNTMNELFTVKYKILSCLLVRIHFTFKLSLNVGITNCNLGTTHPHETK